MYRMDTVPLTIVDEALERGHELPEVLKIASTAEYFKDDKAMWPGYRSKCLSELDYYTYNSIALGVLSLFSSDKVLSYQMSAYFQRVPRGFGRGWVHADTNIFTALIYLNEYPNPLSGTSTYFLNPGVDRYTQISTLNDAKHEALSTGTLEDYEKYGELNNSLYTEDVRIPAKHNRMVCFDGQISHAAGEFSAGEEERLTLVLFFYTVEYEGEYGMPLSRMKRGIV